MPSPKPARVAARALVFCAVSMRAYLETERAPDTAGYQSKMLRWLEAHGTLPEFERDELAYVRAEIGALNSRAVQQGLWRSEALGVVAWALGYAELPPFHEEFDQQVVMKTLGFMRGGRVLKAPELRARDELLSYARRARALHWRLRELTLRHGKLDWAETARTLPFLDVPGIELVGRDLALGRRPISRAKPATLKHALSIASERHQAIAWLTRGGARYSETDTPT